MAKRFTATEKWEDVWFSSLENEQKLFWMYLLDKCDSAGIWEKNFKAASFFLGYEITEQDCSFLEDKVVPVNGSKWFVPKFIEFQYGELSPDCKPHVPIIKQLSKYNLKGYGKGMDTLNTRQEKEQEEEKVKEKNKKEEITDYFIAKGYPAEEAESFFNHYEAQGWVTGSGLPISNWKVKAENWHKEQTRRNAEEKSKPKSNKPYQAESIKPAKWLQHDTSLCDCGCGEKAKFRKDGFKVASENCYKLMKAPLSQDITDLANSFKV